MNKTSFQLKQNILTVSVQEKTIAKFDLNNFKLVNSTFDTLGNFGNFLPKKKVHSLTDITDFELETHENQAKVVGKVNSSIFSFLLDFSSNYLNFEVQCEKAQEIQMSIDVTQDELIYGFGEQFSNIEFSNKRFDLITSEQGMGRGAQPVSALVNLAVGKGASGDQFSTYAPLPTFLTSKNRGMCFETQTIYSFDVKKKFKNQIIIQAYQNNLKGFIVCENSPLDLLEKMTEKSGRLRPLPDFAYDNILGVRGGREVVDKILTKCKEHNAPVSAVWIEDWQGRRGKNGGPPLWWRWFPDQKLYPDFKNWASDLKKEGIALLGYVNPFLSADQSNPLYLEAIDNDLLVKDKNGEVWHNSFVTGKEYRYVHVDLTNPKAYEWLKEKMRVGMIENGLSGWMADYGEYIPLDSQSFEKDAKIAHAKTPMLWAKLNYELLKETDNLGKFLIFHRSAGAGSNKYATAFWAGDQNPTFDKYDGLESSICALISSGLSGMTINHTDIGGFTTIINPLYKLVRSKEVMLRWLEFGAFTPVFRTHDGAFANPLNYQFYYDEEGYAFYAKMGRLHSSLKWYYKLLEKDATEKGIPMVRAMWLHYPNDKTCLKLKNQYLLGEDILVRPVTKSKAKTVSVYIPDGEWICPHSDRVFTQGKYNLPATLGFPPVLIRKASENAEKLINTIKSVLK